MNNNNYYYDTRSLSGDNKMNIVQNDSSDNNNNNNESTPLIPMIHNTSKDNDGGDNNNENNNTVRIEQEQLQYQQQHHDRSNNNNNNNSHNNTNNNIQYARQLLYISHSISQCTQQIYEFTILLLLAAITNFQSVLYVSTYGILSGSIICLFSTHTSRYFVDYHTTITSTSTSTMKRNDRLISAQFLIGTQNTCVILTTIASYILIQQQTHESATTTTTISFISCIVLIHIFGSLSTLFDKTLLVVIERDWVVVMNEYYMKTNNDNTNMNITVSSKQIHTSSSSIWLSETNVTMKQIDLACRIIAPAISGLFLGTIQSLYDNDHKDKHDFHTLNSTNNHIDTIQTTTTTTTNDGFAITVMIVGILNGISLIVEYICTSQIYYLIPTLSYNTTTTTTTTSTTTSTTSSVSSQIHPTKEDVASSVTVSMPKIETPNRNRNLEHICCCTPTWTKQKQQTSITSSSPSSSSLSGLSIYLSQEISYAGISLALLYFNTLTFGSLMTSYLLWRGMSVETVGFWRGISSALGLVGTFAFRQLAKKYSLITTGMIGITYQLICIAISVVSFYVSTYNLSMIFLIFGVCASRIGLWVFDVTVTQLMQEQIPDGIRGTIGGMQQSLNAFFQLSSFGIGFLLPSPHEFNVYAFIGLVSLTAATVIYFIFIFLRKEKFESNF